MADVSDLNSVADIVWGVLSWLDDEREKAGRCPCCGRTAAEGSHDTEFDCGQLLIAFDILIRYQAAAAGAAYLRNALADLAHSHEPGCDLLNGGTACSCSPYKDEP